MECVNGHTPSRLHTAATAATGAASAPLVLKGTSGSRVPAFLTDSIAQNSPHAAHVSEGRMPRRDLAPARLDDAGTEVSHALEDAVALEDLERRAARRARERVPGVGEAIGNGDGVEVRGDPVGDAAECVSSRFARSTTGSAVPGKA
jgi:hypothetical protein